MTEDITTTTESPAARRAGFVLAAGAGGAVLAATIALWAHYGTAVFFETIRTGLVACFG
jgi:hypothetical protein